eukprot:TRINITY_DN7783_c0_g1_i1.p1 TRINITY_DN7783_c0_g1~~TRINITY_DN7783_c0_g1_i1.p1  ORF type:complete len:248 (-),score=68.89 TRINITY_DN7783_c0_g1_i1:13-735(-)
MAAPISSIVAPIALVTPSSVRPFSSTIPSVNLFHGVVGKILPNGLNWTAEPIRWMFDDNFRLIVQPRPSTDFHNSYDSVNKQDACFLYHVVKGDFTFSSKVGGSLVSVGDAVAITIWSTPKMWAKLCLQRVASAKNKNGELQIVSVVSNPFSDVTYGEIVKSTDIYFRVSRRGDELIMHSSSDGKKWKFIRYFAWAECPIDLAIGIHAQAPTTTTTPCCMGEFYDFSVSDIAVPNFKPYE